MKEEKYPYLDSLDTIHEDIAALREKKRQARENSKCDLEREMQFGKCNDIEYVIMGALLAILEQFESLSEQTRRFDEVGVDDGER